MNYKIITLISTIFMMMLGLSGSCQNTQSIAGQYSFQGGLLIINPDNTFYILGYGTLIKGDVLQKDSDLEFVPYRPKLPYVVYGRYSSELNTGNKIMFQGFDEVQSLINREGNGDSMHQMKHVYNNDANCIDYPAVNENKTKIDKLYLTIIDSNAVYEYLNTEGYNDFIAIYLPQYGSRDLEPIHLTLKNDKIYSDGEIVNKRVKNEINEKELEQLMGMFDRAFSESENYYCNPAYNVFEGYGIDLSQYDKTNNGNEYYFINKHNEPLEDDDYHDISKIYEYKKITPTIVDDYEYTVSEESIFNFNCDSE